MLFQNPLPLFLSDIVLDSARDINSKLTSDSASLPVSVPTKPDFAPFSTIFNEQLITIQ